MPHGARLFATRSIEREKAAPVGAGPVRTFTIAAALVD
jgi:hypothetical protein